MGYQQNWKSEHISVIFLTFPKAPRPSTFKMWKSCRLTLLRSGTSRSRITCISSTECVRSKRIISYVMLLRKIVLIADLLSVLEYISNALPLSMWWTKYTQRNCDVWIKKNSTALKTDILFIKKFRYWKYLIHVYKGKLMFTKLVKSGL